MYFQQAMAVVQGLAELGHLQEVASSIELANKFFVRYQRTQKKHGGRSYLSYTYLAGLTYSSPGPKMKSRANNRYADSIAPPGFKKSTSHLKATRFINSRDFSKSQMPTSIANKLFDLQKLILCNNNFSSTTVFVAAAAFQNLIFCRLSDPLHFPDC